VLEALKMAGVQHPIEIATNGQEALERLSSGKPLSLVLLDIKMPIKDGFQVLEGMKDRIIGIPVIILSGSAQPSDIEKAYRLGANAFLVKPASLEKLAQMMDGVKRFWLESNFTVFKAKGPL